MPDYIEIIIWTDNESFQDCSMDVFFLKYICDNQSNSFSLAAFCLLLSCLSKIFYSRSKMTLFLRFL